MTRTTNASSRAGARFAGPPREDSPRGQGRVKSTHVALYGSVAMARGWCSSCAGTALIIGGRFGCCDAPSRGEIGAVKRMSSTAGRRRIPTSERQSALLAEQGKRMRLLRDAFRIGGLPTFSFSASSTDSEFAAACQICNEIKGDQMFQTFSAARAELALARRGKGWSF